MRIQLRLTTIAIAVMLFLASIACLTSNVQAQRRTKRKAATIQKVTVALTEKRIPAWQSQTASRDTGTSDFYSEGGCYLWHSGRYPGIRHHAGLATE